MEAKPPPASLVPEGSAPPAAVALPALVTPKAAAHGTRTALGLGAGMLALVLAFAGYRLYEKDRAETAAELVRIKAYLEARAQAEAVPDRERVKPPTTERVAAAAPVATRLPASEPATAVLPTPRPANARPAAEKRAPPTEARAKPAEVRTKPVEVRSKPPKVDSMPAEAPVHTAERPKSVDRLWRERTARECADGFVGFICREWLKFDLCREHDAWGKAPLCPAAEKPPPTVMSGSVG